MLIALFEEASARWRLFLSFTLACLCAASLTASLATARSSPMTAAFIIKKVSSSYGDKKPRLLHVETTRTEAVPHDVMYFIQLAGNFHRGRTKARYLYFSALARRWYVWGVQGYDVHHHLLWTDPSVRRQ